jgi:hypothetical protein
VGLAVGVGVAGGVPGTVTTRLELHAAASTSAAAASGRPDDPTTEL